MTSQEYIADSHYLSINDTVSKLPRSESVPCVSHRIMHRCIFTRFVAGKTLMEIPQCTMQCVIIAPVLVTSFLTACLCPESAGAQILRSRLTPPEVLRACDDAVTNVTFNLLAQEVAPVFWFSPDEPLITGANRNIGAVGIPENFRPALLKESLV